MELSPPEKPICTTGSQQPARHRATLPSTDGVSQNALQTDDDKEPMLWAVLYHND